MNLLADIGERVHFLLEVTLFEVHGVTITVGDIGAFVLAVVLAALAGRIANRALTRALRRGPTRASEGTAYALGRVLQYIVTVVGILVGLENIGISMTTLAALGAMLAVGLGFGLQNIAQNFVSGLILLLEQPIKKGDVVIVDGVHGVVDEISIRATRIMTFDDVALIVPNSKFISDVVENRSEPSTTFRIRIPVGVAYGTDTLLVHETLLQVAKDDDAVLRTPEPVCFFRNFGDSSLDFELCCFIDDPLGAAQVGSVLRHKITKAFADANISIPFPQRDVHLIRG
jgi:small-conductance mechanosensitive channel